MSYTHRFGKDGYFGIGEAPDAGAPRKPKTKAEPVKKVNAARDNIPLDHPRYKQSSYA